MINDLLRSFYSTIMKKEAQVYSAPDETKQRGSTSTVATETQSAPSHSLSEVEVIETAFGKLYEGKVIQTELKVLLSLLPRKRQRSDAYKGLIKELAAIGVTLKILPHHMLNQNHGEQEED